MPFVISLAVYIYRIVLARGFSSSNYTLLKRRKNLRSPLKRDRFTSFALFRFLYFYLFLSFSLVSCAFDCVSWYLKGCHPYRLALFFLPFLLSILLHPLPTSISTETARHLGKQASKQANKQGISNEGFFRYFFSATRLLLASPLSFAFFLAFSFFTLLSWLSTSLLYNVSGFNL